jgi:bifunctional non-homologous end joining protein LigD
MPLETYRRKRNFSRTPEPKGTPRPRRKKKGELEFVVQKHAARRLHYDFRLEMDGVLKSWAVPKGPSLDPREKRLAVQVEDHPIEYGSFEGAIPAGEYGGGTVLLWDRGTWRSLEGEPLAAWRQGKLKIELFGEKLRGGWTLVRMHGQRAGDNHENWLLIKENDSTARPGGDDELVRRETASVASGKTIEEIAADPPRVWSSNRATELEPAARKAATSAAAAATAATGKLAPTGRARAAASTRAAGGAKRGTSTSPARAGAAAGRAAVAAAAATASRTGGQAAVRRGTGAAERRRLADLAAAVPGARRAPMPRTVEPELATLVSAPPTGDQWLHEIKFDGYRVICEIERGKARLLTRRGKDWSDRFPPVAAAAAELTAGDAVLDGEVTVLLLDGKTSFQALQESLGEAGGEGGEVAHGGVMVYFAFDLLYLEGHDLRRAPLAARKDALRLLLETSAAGPAPAATAPAEGPIRFSDHVAGQGLEFYRQACRHGLEGIVSKRADQPYHAGRGKDWLKVKCLQRQEMVIGGFTDPEGARAGLGALLLGTWEGDRLVYAGKVGTGFSAKTLLELRRRLDRLERKTPPFADPPRGAEARRAHWVEPKLVCEVAFTEWTRDGHLRHPTFLGLREDKEAREVRRELPQAPPEESGDGRDAANRPAGGGKDAAQRRTGGKATATKAGAGKDAARRRTGGKATETKAGAGGQRAAKRRAAGDRHDGGGKTGTGTRAVAARPAVADRRAVAPATPAGRVGAGRSGAGGGEVAGVRLTHPDKVMFPGLGLTKHHLALYYENIADWILPHLADRPLTLVRCPEGQGRECFYQKHVTDQFPAAVLRVPIEEGGKTVEYGAVDSVAGLVSLVQMGVLEIHIWGAHRDQVERPDYAVFDLDPDAGLPWERVVEAALELREVLAAAGLRSFLKTTGGKGLHVVLPLARRHGWDKIKVFTRAVAEAMAAARPDRYTSNPLKARRQGRIYVDYLRNGRGATSIAAYSCRSRPGAPVSTPLAWEELEDGVRADTFTVENLPERLAGLTADPWREMSKVKQSITAAMKRGFGVAG